MQIQSLGVDADGAVSQRVSGWRAVVRILRSPAQQALDDVITTIFPADCRCCDGPLLCAADVPVCDACLASVRRESLPGCGRCGEALDLDLDMEDARFAGMLPEGLLCRECRMAAPEFARAVAYSSYEDEMRELIRLLKFERVRSVAKLLAPKLAEVILSLEAEAARELTVIAVPLFAARVKQRGYNQSVLLADEALRCLRQLRPAWQLTAAHTAMERRRSTESSFVLSRAGRRRNLRGAFRVVEDIAGQEILLIDDIYTSGATARECARVLIRAGAAKVWVATLARAQKGFVRRQHADATEFVAKWDLNLEGK